MATPATIAIVGASLTGASAAATLREEGFDGRVVLHRGGAPAPVRSAAALEGVPARRDAVREDALAAAGVLPRARDRDCASARRVTRVDAEKRGSSSRGASRSSSTACSSPPAGETGAFRFPASTCPASTICARWPTPIASARRSRAAAARSSWAWASSAPRSAGSLRECGLEVVAIEPFKTPLFRALGEEIGRVVEGSTAITGSS